jgi:hypothetical protein
VTGTDPTNPSAVVNADVHNACERGAVAERVNIAGFALLGVGVAATAAFTALLFFPRRGKRESASRWRRREPMVGLSPSRGGAFVSGSFRF